MIDLTKEHQTRNGLKVSHLHTVKSACVATIGGTVRTKRGLLAKFVWRQDGRYYDEITDSGYDLVEVEEQEELITQEDYDMVCRENSAFANHLHRMGFTDEQISNIANGGNVND